MKIKFLLSIAFFFPIYLIAGPDLPQNGKTFYSHTYGFINKHPYAAANALAGIFSLTSCYKDPSNWKRTAKSVIEGVSCSTIAVYICRNYLMNNKMQKLLIQSSKNEYDPNQNKFQNLCRTIIVYEPDCWIKKLRKEEQNFNFQNIKQSKENELFNNSLFLRQQEKNNVEK